MEAERKPVFMAIDRGNTLLKATVLRGDEVLAHKMLDAGDVDALLLFAEYHEVEEAAMVAVGRVDVRLAETLRNFTDGRFMLLTHSTSLPIGVDYSPAESLGLDRVCAAAGAALLYPGRRCVVVDAGTAMTIDVVGEKGVFEGGAIAPGMRLRFGSLHAYTALLPLIEWDGKEDIPLTAHTTRGAILSGVVGGMASEIRCAMDGRDAVVITGGDGGKLFTYLQQTLQPEESDRLMYEPHLLARGLQYIYRHHEQNL